MRDYAAPDNNAWTWDTSTRALGTYSVAVWTRSAGSTADLDTQAIVSYTLSTPPPAPVAPATAVGFAPPPDPASPQTPGPGTSVTFTASASGGTGTYEYRFWLFNGTSWTLEKDYTGTGPGSDTWIWDTSTRDLGLYYVAVWTRSFGRTADLDTQAIVSYVLQ